MTLSKGVKYFQQDVVWEHIYCDRVYITLASASVCVTQVSACHIRGYTRSTRRTLSLSFL